mmetsp:Transcript_20994/g.38487  ORF Transcript_20994/g.38487 Transcript_20994/m.38487 type:complete len:311 (+) Transcript_20994:42-974(+)
MERYERLSRPGLRFLGGFSPFFHARDKNTDEDVIIKRVPYNNFDAGEVIRDTQREISILKELSTHENIVQLKDSVDDSTYKIFFLVFERLRYDLKYVLDRERNIANNVMGDSVLTQRQIKSYLYQCCRGLAFCHEKGVMHRNLMPQHMLLTGEGVLKLAGFGLSRSLRDGRGPLTHEVVTLWYRPPEILLGSQLYDSSIDIWSLGCIFAEMIMRYPLLPGRSQIDQLYKIFQQFGTPNEDIWPGVTSFTDWNNRYPKWYVSDFHKNIQKNVDPLGHELLEMFLLYNPSDRISAKDALEHPYFDGLNEGSN